MSLTLLPFFCNVTSYHSAVRLRLKQADEWLLDVKERCKLKGGASIGPITTAANGTTAQVTATAAATRRKGKEKVGSHTYDEGDGLETGTHYTKQISSLHSPTLSTKGALLALLKVGQGLGIDVSRELALIAETIAAIERWDSLASSALLSLDSIQLSPLIAGYRELLNGATDTSTKMDITSDIKTSQYCKDPPFPCVEGLSGQYARAGTAEGSKREGELWKRFLSFSTDLQQLRDQAFDLGIGGIEAGEDPAASSSVLQLELCLSAIRWIREARQLLCFPSSPSVNTTLSGDLVPGSSDTAHSKSLSETVLTPEGGYHEKEEMRSEKAKKPVRKQKGDTQLYIPEQASVTAEVATELLPEVTAVTLYWGDCCR